MVSPFAARPKFHKTISAGSRWVKPNVPDMRVLFRTDASLDIGAGHVMRCLTLADELFRRGYECFFICRDHYGHLGDRIVRHGYALHLLPVVALARSKDPCDQPCHLGWLGDSWENDAEQTAAFLLSNDVDLVVVDHYALDCRWEEKIRPLCQRILVIDDLANRTHNCDFLLDQNLVAELGTRYADKVPRDCLLMLGPSYALLQSQYSQINRRIPYREGRIDRILIYFGAADSDNLTEMAITACLPLPCHIDVVINSTSPHIDALRKLSQGSSRMALYEDMPSLADLMATADLAIGAGGATSWERCCLGLPSLVITLADNQKSIAAEMNRKGFFHWLGHKNEVTQLDLNRIVRTLFENGLDKKWSVQCTRLVDGLGVSRVCDLLALGSGKDLLARPATRDDEQFFVDSMQRMDRETTKAWLHQILRDLVSKRLFIIETQKGTSIGWGLFSLLQGGWELAANMGLIAGSSKLHTFALGTLLTEMRKSISGILRIKSDWLNDYPEGLQTITPKIATGTKSLRITICSDSQSWLNSRAAQLILSMLSASHEVSWVHAAEDAPGGDLCFYLSYSRISNQSILAKYTHNLVVHESALPQGRGWAPMSWQILEGKSDIPITLFEAVNDVDAGPIYLQEIVHLNGSELHDEWRSLQADSTLRLCRYFYENYPAVVLQARPQDGKPSTYPRRRSTDSCLDIDETIKDQFDLLRVVNNDKYPAFFDLDNNRFILRIEKVKIV
jgi:UDP-2,4-diacetamido-2,4,6-trideoxy-beta-L-altropyranose hydrolase